MPSLVQIFMLFASLLLVAGNVFATPIRILILGDSISQGGQGQPGYRHQLMRLLNGEDFLNANPDHSVHLVEFVGSMSTTFGTNPPNSDSKFANTLALHPNHEGHWGWRTDHILFGNAGADPGSGTGSLASWLSNYTADIALIHLGTNDAITNAAASVPDPNFALNSWMELGAVLQDLEGDNSGISLFLAKLIPIRASLAPFWAETNGYITDLNMQIETWIGTTNAAMVEFPGISAVDDSYDGIHPDESGEQLMAAAWFTAMKPTLDLLSWRCANFGSASGVGNGADSFDFDGDGSLNLLEWALLDMDPTTSDTPPVSVAIVGNRLTITASKNPLAVGVSYEAESGGAPGVLSVANTEVLIDNATTFSARDKTLLSAGGNRFIRLRVSR